MIIVTGAAGFIGSCIVAELNQRGMNDVLVVDHLKPEDGNPERCALKQKNLNGKGTSQFYDKKEFLALVKEDRMDLPIEAVIHMGACSSTTLQDADYYRENNLEYTIDLAQWALKHDIRFIYASSAATYGDGLEGYSDDHNVIPRCHPLNLYGQSKQDFDLWALEHGHIDRMVGLKFFNVFGPNEYHKEDMKSVVAKAYPKVKQEGRMSLFKSYKENYGDGEQKRDFIYVKDAVNVVMFFMDNPDVNGVFNVGTGEARSWNDLAGALFAATGQPTVIDYIDMPEVLRTKYQYFTQADMSKLRLVGYDKPFTGLEDAVKDYVGYLEQNRYI